MSRHTRRTSTRKMSVGAAAGLVVLMALTGCNSTTGSSGSGTGAAAATASGSGSSTTAADPTPAIPASAAALSTDLAGVTQRKVATVAPTRLAPGLVAPTNRWFSGLVFGDKPQPVFPMPLSAALTDTGFAVGLPTVTTSAKTIMGGNNPQIQVPLGAGKMRVTAYDTLTVTATYSDPAGGTLGSVVLAQGSPFVTYTAAKSQTIPVEPIFQRQSAGGYAVTVAGHQYGLVLGKGATIDGGGKVTLAAGSTLTVLAAPDGAALSTLTAAAGHPVVGGSVTHAIDGDRVTTTLRYRTADGGPTAVAVMAGQTVADPAATAASYPSIYGAMKVYGSSVVTTTAPLAAPSGQLDVSGLSAADKAAVVAQVKLDAKSIDFSADDTYFGGKFLYRAANLMTLAEQLGVTDVAASLRKQLTAELTKWFDPQGCATRASKCFVYDPAIHSMIGLKASFGSDQLNDHHFHYGYLLYAAAVVGKDDPALTARIAPVVDLLAADIASSDATSSFPQYRNFDPYSGHSWASGTSPFADGNNQESSSEAVNAWNGLALWEQLRGNTAGYDQARWMMSVEAQGARLYWTNTDLSAFPAFTGKIVALNWGGKRDYATWFSADPSAMLGIQLIPMGPYAQYLAGDPARIKTNLAAVAAGGYGVQFGEYMVQYLALADPAAARAQLGSLPKVIDNGTTKSYVMAWVFSRKNAPTG